MPHCNFCGMLEGAAKLEKHEIFTGIRLARSLLFSVLDHQIPISPLAANSLLAANFER